MPVLTALSGARSPTTTCNATKPRPLWLKSCRLWPCNWPPRHRRSRDCLATCSGAEPKSSPRGLYIHGEVGRGKTMLMDLFYEHVKGWTKKRIHFHAFMQEVHKARAQQKTIEQIADSDC